MFQKSDPDAPKSFPDAPTSSPSAPKLSPGAPEPSPYAPKTFPDAPTSSPYDPKPFPDALPVNLNKTSDIQVPKTSFFLYTFQKFCSKSQLQPIVCIQIISDCTSEERK